MITEIRRKFWKRFDRNQNYSNFSTVVSIGWEYELKYTFAGIQSNQVYIIYIYTNIDRINYVHIWHNHWF